MQSTEKPSTGKASTGKLYADLAEYYDQFCAEVDYVEQCNFAQRAFSCFSATDERKYLDLACGTGQHLVHMQEHGFIPHGLDNSAEMLRQAALRCPKATLLLCDMAAIEAVGQFDLVTCFLYSIHYSYPTTALEETLRRVWQALRPGGVFIFNTVDARGIRNDDGIVTRLTEGESQLTFESRWHYRGEGEVLDLFLSIRRDAAQSSQHWHDHHTMTALSLPQLRTMLDTIGYDVTLLEHDYSRMAPWSGTGFNVIVIAGKPLAP